MDASWEHQKNAIRANHPCMIYLFSNEWMSVMSTSRLSSSQIIVWSPVSCETLYCTAYCEWAPRYSLWMEGVTWSQHLPSRYFSLTVNKQRKRSKNNTDLQRHKGPYVNSHKCCFPGVAQSHLESKSSI